MVIYEAEAVQIKFDDLNDDAYPEVWLDFLNAPRLDRFWLRLPMVPNETLGCGVLDVIRLAAVVNEGAQSSLVD